MARSSPVLDRALGMLLPLGDVRPRGMFGGWGLFLDGVMFALVKREALFLKVDDETRDRFAAAGARPYVYQREGRAPVEMSYWTLPEDRTATPADLLPWAELAVAASRRNAARKRDRRPERNFFRT